MLVEIAIGDAYGAGMEYVAPEYTLLHNKLQWYCKHPTYHALNPGQYTDDTQMSLAVAEVLLKATDFSSLTKRDFIEAFFTAFKRDPRNGYSRQFQSFLEQIESPDAFEATIRSDSEKSGGAMRTGPVGFLPSLDLVDQVSALQASVTHDTKLGRDAARAAALSVYYCRNKLGSKKNLDQFLHQYVSGYRWSEDWNGRIGQVGIWHVRAATTMIRHVDRLSNILRSIVAMGGDVDTAAAIAMAIGSQSSEIENDLPAVLYSNLEHGQYGFDYLSEIDLQLEQKFTLQSKVTASI